MAGAARQILGFIFNLATVPLRITQMFIDATDNDKGEIVFAIFSLLDNSVSCNKLLFIAAYHQAHTEGSEVFASVCLFGSGLIVLTIMIHLNRNYKTWARIQIVGMATFLALAVGMLRYGMLTSLDHAWHTVAVPSIICSLVWVEVALLIRTQIKNDGGDQHLLRDLLIKLAETPISIYRCIDLIQNPDSPWNAQKILLLLGSGPPTLIGACQIAWIVYKVDAISKLAEWLMKIHGVFARKTEHKAAGPAMEADEGAGAEDQRARETAEVGDGLPVTIGASQVGWIAYTAGIKFKVIKWFKKIRGVPAVEDEQAAGVAMEIHGGGDSVQQVQEQNVQVVVVAAA